MTNTPDPLDELIASWNDTPAAAPDLRRRVWARIDSAEARRPRGFLQAWRDTIATLVRHRAAVGWVAACIALGLVCAVLGATRLPMRDLGQMAAIYLQTINPLLRDSGSSQP